MSAAKRAATFRLDDEIVVALQAVKDRHGIPIAEQVNRALAMWLETMGVGMTVRGGVTRRLQERLKGAGELRAEDGASKGPASYDLSIWQEMHDISGQSGEQVEGLKEVMGTIAPQSPAANLFNLVGESLVLVLSDGRTFPFFFQNLNGRIAARGGISEK